MSISAGPDIGKPQPDRCLLGPGGVTLSNSIALTHPGAFALDQIPYVRGARARALFNAGLRSVPAVATATVEVIRDAIGGPPAPSPALVVVWVVFSGGNSCPQHSSCPKCSSL